MKTLIKYVLLVVCLMVVGHFAVTGQEQPSFKIEETASGWIATQNDSSDFAIVLEIDGGSYMAFRGVTEATLNGTAVLQKRCTGEVLKLPLADYAQYDHTRGIMFIQMTNDINSTLLAINDYTILNSIIDEEGKALIVPDLPNLSLTLYYLANGACEECGFVKPACDTSKL